MASLMSERPDAAALEAAPLPFTLSRIHHVAYRCRDAKQTADWYKAMLGMEFTTAFAEDHVPSTGAYDPYMHIFLECGGGNVIAFFELPKQPAMGKDPNTPEWVQHIAFEVDSIETLLRAKAHLEAAGVEVLGPTFHGIFRSIYFFDPNGHRLELACNIGTPEQYAELRRVAPMMLDEWSQTKKAPRHAEWLHIDPGTGDGVGMKLASLKQGRDGKLVVVSADLAWYADASHIAPTMQAALDDWDRVEPMLRALSTDIDHEVIPRERFHERDAASPLPRAYQWADGSAYVNHVALVRQARGAEMPESFWHDPLMYQGGSDGFLGLRDPIPLADATWGCDMEAEVVVVTGDVPQGVSAEAARELVRLVGLTNDVSLRNLIPGELAKGFGFFQSKPASAMSPVFVTPDALGARWNGGKLSGTLNVDLNGLPLGRADAGVDMTFDFGQLIAHAARSRSLVAGTIIGSGTVSNRDADGGPGKPVSAGGLGYSCLAEVRTIETIQSGAPVTPFMQPGDTVRIWMDDDRHHSIFGAIEQSVIAA